MKEIELSKAIDVPAILRGTVSASRWEGVVQGAGLPPESRRQNLKSLQAAIDHAAGRGKFFELEPGLYPIEGESGLVVPAGESGFVWRGSKGSHIVQFSDNAPVLTVGDVEGSRMTGNADIRGVRLSYKTDQTMNAGASALRLGLMRSSILENIAIFADMSETGPIVRAHRGIHIVNATNPFGFFSNSMRDVIVAGAARHLLDFTLLGTGSVFQNVYLIQGTTGHPAPIAGEAFRVAGNNDLYESVFENLNVEWCIANVLMTMQNCRATSFIGCHLEGNRIHGHDPRVMQVTTSQLALLGFNILDLEVPAAGSDGLPPQIFGFYGDCALTGSGLQVSWSGAGRAGRRLHLCAPNRYDPAGARHAIALTDVTLRDLGGDNAPFVDLDPNLPRADFPGARAIERFVSRQDGLSRVEGATLSPDADITVYAQFHEPRIEYPASLGEPRVVTLSNRMKASGEGASAKPPGGSMVTVRRGAGTADAFPILVKNHDGALLQKISSANATLRFQFDGTRWNAVA